MTLMSATLIGQGQRRLAFIWLALLSLAVGACFGAPAQAQFDNANSGAGFWLQDRDQIRPRRVGAARPSPKVRRLVPHRSLARPTPWRAPTERIAPESAPGAAKFERPKPAGPTAGEPRAEEGASPLIEISGGDQTPQPAIVPQSPPAAFSADSFKIAVIGDSMALQLAGGMIEALNEGDRITHGMEPLRRARESSGLVREDFYDWRKGLNDLLSSDDKINAVVILIGSNDKQELRDETGKLEPMSPRWIEAYRARVTALIEILRARKMPFVWIGLPIMKFERYSGDMRRLNMIYRIETEAAGGKFLETLDIFADENGRYTAFGPDVSGQIAKLRSSDGVHFTKAGARKLAHFAYLAIRPLAEAARRPPQQLAPPPFLSPEAIDKTTQENPASPPFPAPPAPDAAAPIEPQKTVIVKPEVGPIISLSSPPQAKTMELAGPKRASESAGFALSPELAAGRTPAPKPGRADDFAWPR